MRLDKAAALFLRNVSNPTTRDTYSDGITPLVEFVGPAREIEQVKPEHIIEYVATLHERDYAPATLRRHIKTVKTFFNWLIKAEIITVSPARVVKTPKTPLYVTRDKAMQDKELSLVLDRLRWKPRDYALVLFVADTGCRAGGASNLRLEDIDLDAKTAYVTEKGNKRRPVWFEDKCRAALKQWLIRRKGHKGNFVFSHDGRKIKPANISQIIRRACIEAGVRSLGSHSLRHRKGHQLADDKTAPSIAAVALGHESIETTLNHYYPHDYKSAEDAIRRLAATSPATSDESDKIIRLPVKGTKKG